MFIAQSQDAAVSACVQPCLSGKQQFGQRGWLGLQRSDQLVRRPERFQIGSALFKDGLGRAKRGQKLACRFVTDAGGQREPQP